MSFFLLEVETLDKQLKEILDLLHQNDIAYWLDSGTLLGLMREGKLLKNDEDIDIGVWSTEEQKIKNLFPVMKKSGYVLYSASFEGKIFKYNFTSNHNKDLRKVDINIFREAHGHAWCPMYYFKFNTKKVTSNGINKRTKSALRGFIRACWKKFLTKISLKINISSFPWRSFVNLGTWWIPDDFFNNIVYNNNINAYIPEKWERYLEFRYGNWRKPEKSWVFYRDDKGIRDIDPINIFNKDKLNVTGGTSQRHEG